MNCSNSSVTAPDTGNAWTSVEELAKGEGVDLNYCVMFHTDQ